MTKRFEFAYNALVQAFFNGTLAKGTCTACAVGNMVAAANDFPIERIETEDEISFEGDDMIEYWSDLFFTTSIGQLRRNHATKDEDVKIALSLIEKTGYSEDELAKIEFAFETHTQIQFDYYHKHSEQEILEDQYNGLCAVFEVLCKLDNVKGVDYKAKLQEREGLVLA